MQGSFLFRHCFRSCLLIVGLLAPFLLTSPVEASVLYRVQKIIYLTDLNPSADGTIPMSVTGLNASGRMVGYFPSSDQNKLHAFVWDDATHTLTDLNVLLNADSSMATCVNANGQVAGIFWALDGNYTQMGFIYHPDGAITTFVPPNRGMISSINAINVAGHVIGTYGFNNDSTRGFFFSEANSATLEVNAPGFVDLGDLGDSGDYVDYIWPSALNNSDQVSGFITRLPAEYHSHEYTNGFSWQGGTLNVVDDSSLSGYSEIVALNDTGSMAGLFGTGAIVNPFSSAGSFFWDGVNLTDLGDLGGGNGANVFALTPAGVAVGTSLAADGQLHLFSWRSGGNSAITDQGIVSLFNGDASFQPYSLGMVTGVVDGNGEPAYDLTGFGADASGNTVPLLWKSGSIYNVSNLLPAYLSFHTISNLYGSQVIVNSSEQIACAGTSANGQQVALLLSPDPDIDNDGLPDSWEIYYFGNLDQTASGDFDGDGSTNLYEFQHNTDPTLPDGVSSTGGTGLILHLQADAGVTVDSAGKVTQWADQSGQNNHATQATAAQQPVLVANAANGKPAIRFAGSQYVDLPNCLSTATAGEMIMVLKSTAAGGLSSFGTADDFYPDPMTQSWVVGGFGSHRSYFEGDAVPPLGNFNIYDASSQVGLWCSWLNGLLFFADTDSYNPNDPEGDPPNAVFFTTAPKIGVHGFWSSPYNDRPGFSGDVAEVLVYNHVLSETERSAVHAYLTRRYLLGSAPVAPTGVEAFQLAGSQVCVTWKTTPVGSRVDYVVERAASLTGTYTKVATLDNAGTYFDNSVVAGQQYFYRVYAQNAIARSAAGTPAVARRFASTSVPLPTNGLQLWLSADAAAQSPLDRWRDLSGNGHDGYQRHKDRRPTIVPNGLNGQPVLQFATREDSSPYQDSNEYFQVPQFHLGANGSEMVVVAQATAPSYLTNLDRYPDANGNIVSSFGSSTNHDQGKPPFNIKQFNLYDVSSQPNLFQSWFNGVPYYSDTNNTATGDVIYEIGHSYLTGISPGPSCAIAELFIYDRPLTAAERSTISYYFARKYRLPNMDPDHDGLNTGLELALGSDPFSADTNGDGIDDRTAYLSGLSLTNLDMDGDTISNAQEIINGTNPFDADTDHDGVPDNLDYYPLDPTRSQAPTQTPGVPVLTLNFPPGVDLHP